MVMFNSYVSHDRRVYSLISINIPVSSTKKSTINPIDPPFSYGFPGAKNTPLAGAEQHLEGARESHLPRLGIFRALDAAMRRCAGWEG